MAGLNELEAIATLKALITSMKPDPPLPEPTTELRFPTPVKTTEQLVNDPVSHPIQTTAIPPSLPNMPHATTIPFNKDELDDTCVTGAMALFAIALP